MSVPTCATCVYIQADTGTCAHPDLQLIANEEPWFVVIVRSFELDELGNAWCGPLGIWHRPRTKEDQTA